VSYTTKTVSYFLFIFLSAKPFYSAALGRLIEQAADLGFMVGKKPKHRFCVTSIRTGVPFSPNLQTPLRENGTPDLFTASRK